MDDLDEDNISAEAGKQGLAELFHTQTNIKPPNYIELQNIFEYKFCSHKRNVFSIPHFPKKNMKKDPPDNIFLFYSHYPAEHISKAGAYASFSPCLLE